MTTADQMPHNLCQWIVYIVVVAAGVMISWGAQRFFLKVLLDPVKVVQKARERVMKLQEKPDGEGAKLPEWQFGHLGTGLQEWVGTIEIILYASSVVFGYPEFIAAWFATKYVASYKTWAKEPVGRTFYNRSLFGSGLNILIGFFTGRLAMWAIWRVGSH
ncbi:MAG TPA: hypothetical protein VGR84_15685 [Candidatus Acidoferrales bacterium]|nr:hypothetical protein [Candidatus Acidoferrales bacterium]